jgi:hypothetical protein
MLESVRIIVSLVVVFIKFKLFQHLKYGSLHKKQYPPVGSTNQ